MTMNRISCIEPGKLVLEEAAHPVRGPGEAVVRIRRVGLCGTDYHILRGTQPYLSYPRVFGHELAGEIADAAPESAWKPGDRVCVLPYHSCGGCIACRKGKPNCCTDISVLGVHKDGGLAHYLAVDERFLVAAEGLTFDAIAQVEFLAIGCHAVRRAAITAGERVLVVGAGPIGLAVSYFAARAGASVTVLDSNEARVRLAGDALGASHGVCLGPDTGDRLARITDGEFYDAVFDATGNPAAMEAGFAYVAHGGRYILVSIVMADITFNDPEFHKREMSIIGSRNATMEEFEIVIGLLKSGEIPIDHTQSHSIHFEDLPGEMERLMEPGSSVIKALVEV